MGIFLPNNNITPTRPIAYASMMGIVVKQKGFELPTEGLHTAVISRIEDLGIVETANGKRNKACIFFTVLNRNLKRNSDVEAFLSVNKVLDGKGNLSKLLKSLKISYAKEFDLSELVGVRCCVLIRHDEMDDHDAEGRATVTAVLSRR